MKELSPSQIEYFLMQIQRLICLMEDEPIDGVADKINKFENKLILDEIESCLKDKKDGELTPKICAILERRWERIRASTISYTESPFNLVNQFCLDLAKTIYPIPETETEIDALPEGEGPYFILMPSLKVSADVMSTNIHNLLLQQFILSDNDEIYIPIESILERAATSDEGVYQHYVTADGNYPELSADELKRLKNHSTIINDYILAIEQLNDLRIRGSGLGAKLQSLVNALRAGGSHQGQNFEEARRLGLDPHLNAGSKANIGIMDFAEYWDKVPGDTKREYLRKYPGLIEPIDRLFHPNDVKYRTAILCVELIADAIETVITSNRLSTQSLEQFELKVATKKEIFLRQIKSDKYILLPSLAQLPNIYADIFKLPIDKQKLIFRGYENLCMYLLDNDPLALIEFKDLISEEIRQGICTKKYRENQTPLMKAASAGSTHVVNLLLDLRVNIDDLDSHGNTALMHALRANNKDVFISLLEKGASILPRNITYGHNSLDVALTYKPEFVDMLLLKAMSLGDDYQKEYLRKISCGSYKSIFDYILANNSQLIVALLEDAISKNNRKILDAIVDAKGLSMLMVAIKHGNNNLVCRLIDESRLNIDALDSEGNTALIYAVKSRNVDILTTLLSRNANLTLRNKLEQNVCDIACNYYQHYGVSDYYPTNFFTCQKRIYDINFNIDFLDKILFKAAFLSLEEQQNLLSSYYWGTYKSVLSYFADNRPRMIIEIINKALDLKHHDILDQKIQLGLICDMQLIPYIIRSSDIDSHLSYSLILRLIDTGVVVLDSQDNNDKTLLYYAVEFGRKDIVSELLDRNANIELKSSLGNMALMSAVINNNIVAFNAILAKNPILTTRNNDQKNVLDLAHHEYCYDTTILDLLLLQASILSLAEQKELLSKIDGGMHKTVLSYAADYRKDLVEKLLNKTIDLKKQDILDTEISIDTDRMPLLSYIMLATGELAPYLALKLIDEGMVDIRQQDISDGNTLLHQAIIWGKKDLVSSMLSRNANLELKNRSGNNALILALKVGNLAIFKLLFAQNLSLIIRDNQGKNVLDLAHDKFNREFIELILIRAAGLSKAEQTELLSKIDNGRHKTVLSYAAFYTGSLVVSLVNKAIDLKQQDVLDEEISVSSIKNLQLVPYLMENRLLISSESCLERLIKEHLIDINHKYTNDVLSYALLKKPNLVMPLIKKIHPAANRLESYIRQTKLLEHIEIIKAKWQEMEAKAQVNPRYVKAAKAAEKFTKKLINETSLLMQIDPNASGYDKKITRFKDNCLSYIKEAKTVLDVHRCDLWKKILGALILALTAPISLSMCALGLFSLKTDSTKKLDSLEHDLRPAMVV